MQQRKRTAAGRQNGRSGRRSGAVTRSGRRDRSAVLKDILLVLCCLVLPPLGFFLVWRCDWNVRYKYAAFAGMALLVAALIIWTPWPSAEVDSGITMVAREPEMEIYGPELPEDVVEGYEPRVGESALSEDQATPKPSEYVYENIGSDFYHTYTCRYTYDSARKLTPYEAYYLGYKPCSACNPPIYTPGTIPN